MKTFPLQSLTIIEAQQKQFALVDSICRHFPGSEFLTGGDLGLTPGLNQPRVTQRVEQVLADAFHAQAAALVQGAGTGAIRAGLAALLKPGQRLLVHDAPVYPTTRVIIEQMGLTLITVDFNDLSALKQVVDEQQPDAALVQHTRQQPQDSYVLADVLATLRAAGVPALTDDNYAVMKVARIGCECGANVSTFSCFKLFGPEGVGAVVGDADVINRIRATLYSGGSQIQGAQALEVLRGLVFAPVMHAVQAGVSERLLALLNGGAVPEVKSAVIANAQSKVLIVEFHQPIAARVLEEAQKRGALPYPVGAESKYEIPPLFYRLSGTFRQANPQSEHCAIRINPNRSGEEPLFIDSSWIPLSRYPDFDEIYVEGSSTYQLFQERFDTRVVSDKKTIDIFAATRPQAKWLKCELGEPLFRISKIAFDQNDKPVHVSELFCRANRITLTIDNKRH